jgi:hypothetical protein
MTQARVLPDAEYALEAGAGAGTLNKEDFLGQDWWLVSTGIDPALEEKRKELGVSFGWTDTLWFMEATKLEEIWRLLETERYDLIISLDEVIDLDKRSAWIDDVIEARTPKEERVEAEPAGTPSGEAGSAAENGTAAPATPSAPGKKPSIFVHKDQKAETEEPAVADLQDAPVSEDVKTTLEEWISDSSIPVDAQMVAEALKDPDFDAKFKEAEEGLDQKLDDLFDELDFDEDEDEGEHADA